MYKRQTQSILGYNYGACNTARVKQAIRAITKLCVAFTAVMFVLAYTAGPLFVRLFSQDPVVIAEASRAIRVCALAVVPLGVQYEICLLYTSSTQNS